MQSEPRPLGVLNGERAVEPVLVPDLGEEGGVARLAAERERGVSGQGPDPAEDDDACGQIIASVEKKTVGQGARRAHALAALDDRSCLAQ